MNKFLTRIGFLAMVVFLALPVTALAQGRGRGKPTDIFVNGHDARDGRWDKDGRRGRRRDNDVEWRRRRAIEEARRRRINDGRYGNYGNYGNYGGYGNYGNYGNFDFRQTALNAGYNNGIQEGRRDRSRGERFEYRDESDFQRATEDYNSRYGNQDLYRQFFRQGFANGYRDGYNGH